MSKEGDLMVSRTFTVSKTDLETLQKLADEKYDGNLSMALRQTIRTLNKNLEAEN